MLLVHKMKLKQNKEQEEFFIKSSGVARFAYNWALVEWKKQFEAGDKPNEAKLREQLNAIKRSEYPWMLEVSKTVPQEAIKNVGIAFTNFFRRVKAGEKSGYPKFKKKGVSKDSFRPDNGSTKDKNALVISGKKVRIPKLGFVKMTERIRFSGKIVGSVISRTADKWFISIVVDTENIPHVRKNHGSCGVDLGINCMAALDNGTKYEPAKALKKYETRLKKAQRILSRRVKGSSNRKKQAAKVARLHYRVVCLRQDTIHKATTDIVLNNDFIAMEDLNVKGMLKSHRLAKAISDISMSEFNRQIKYKANMYGAVVHRVDRWFPSTKFCRNCGKLHDMPLSKRVFKCDCGIPDAACTSLSIMNLVGQALAEVTPLELEALAATCSSETANVELGTDSAA